MHVTESMPEPIRTSLLEHGTAAPPVPERPIQFDDVHPRTGDGKVDLFPAALDAEAPNGLYMFQGEGSDQGYPLALISPASEKTVTSTLGELRERMAALQIHPDDAVPRDLSTGDVARVFNDLGEVHCPVTLNADMKPGTVGLPKGLWRKSTMNGKTANALVPDSSTDVGGGACFNDARVEVTRVVTATLGEQNISLWTETTAVTKQVH